MLQRCDWRATYNQLDPDGRIENKGEGRAAVANCATEAAGG